jgi:drug/metabolite transporter (DMT)-like permease
VADLALLALTLAWGTTFLLVKNALEGTSAGVFLLLRFGLAAAAVAAVWLWRRDRPGPGLWRQGALLGLAMWGGFAFQTLGLRHTTPSRSAFLTGLAVLFVPFLSRFLHRRSVSPSAWAGVALAVVGLAGLYRGAISAEVRWGDLLTLGCAVCYAFQIVWTAEWSARHPLALLTLVQVGTTFALASLLLPLEPPRLGSGPALWATVAFTGLAMTAGAFFVMNWAQRHTSAVRAALIYSLEPVAAAAFSWRFGGEALTAAQLSGGALIVAGVVVGEVGAALRARLRGVGATG